MTKRTKKYNPKKVSQGRVQKLDRLAINDTMVVLVNNGNTSTKNHIVSRSTGVMYPQITTHFQNLLLERKHDWTVYLAILCRDNQGNNYVKAEELYITEPVKQDEIGDDLLKWHEKLYDKQNPQHILGIAWISCPYNTTIDEEFAYNLFEAMEGFKSYAPWQENKYESKTNTEHLTVN